MKSNLSRKYTIYIIYFLMFCYVIYGLVKVQILEQVENKKILMDLIGKNEYKRGLRGTIYSSDGVKLAWSEKVPVIALKEYSQKDQQILEKYLSVEQLTNLRNTGKAELNWEQAFLLKSIGYNIYAVEKRRSYGFLYPLIGSVNADGDGMSGLEYTYNEVLKGKVSVSYGIKTPGGKYQEGIIESEAENGLDLQTSINYCLQKFIYETLTEFDTPSVVIVSKPKTGEILAMVSYPAPNVDLNNLDSLTWQKLVNDPMKPLLNRAISSSYPPGSTFKVVTGLAQMIYGQPSPISCKGVFYYRDSRGRVTGRYNDWLPTGHGNVDIEKALRVSCNVYFYKAALDIGIDNLIKVSKAFGLGEKTGINIPGETTGILPTPDWKYQNIKEKWYPGDTILCGIGQGFLSLTPIQVLHIYNTIANKGVIVKPKLVVNEESSEKHFDIPVPDDYWDIITKGLEEVTTIQGSAEYGGTAADTFKGFPLTVAGKTGTAQTDNGQPHAWFVGFVPSRKPMYSIVVFIEHGKGGGRYAAPIARKIFDYMYKNGFFNKNIKETKEGK
ncbi:MAG: penicillin-binding transpeptidase domain-containing protein [Fervidobacterium sp.]|nr:penicillin-binding transpeptidase domain-containing protein [Fervidobacterium sp.]